MIFKRNPIKIKLLIQKNEIIALGSAETNFVSSAIMKNYKIRYDQMFAFEKSCLSMTWEKTWFSANTKLNFLLHLG